LGLLEMVHRLWDEVGDLFDRLNLPVGGVAGFGCFLEPTTKFR
jgi:hypothetical protein